MRQTLPIRLLPIATMGLALRLNDATFSLVVLLLDGARRPDALVKEVMLHERGWLLND